MTPSTPCPTRRGSFVQRWTYFERSCFRVPVNFAVGPRSLSARMQNDPNADVCFQGELSERHSVASESGSSTDSHAETPENKDGESLLLSKDMGLGTCCCCEHHLSILLLLMFTVKKKYGAGLKFSNLMNIGKKKPSSLESPEKCVDTSGKQSSPECVISGELLSLGHSLCSVLWLLSMIFLQEEISAEGLHVWLFHVSLNGLY